MRHPTRTLRMQPEAYPVAIPHVSWAPSSFYFGHCPMRHATRADWDLLRSCDGTRTLRQLLEEHGASGRDAALIAPWLIWWDAPSPEPSRRPGPGGRLVFSAHPEDAWIGMGGRLLLEADEHPAYVITCFGLLGHALDPQAFRTPGEISAITRDELALAARLAGVTHEHWELPASELRPHAHGPASATEWIKSLLREVVVDALQRVQPREIYVPCAVEPHSDAGILLDVMLALFVEGVLGDAELHVYETAAVAAGYRAVDEFLARFEQSYIALPEYFARITTCHDRKRSLLETFRTRVDHGFREAWAQTARRNAFLARLGSGEGAEHYWRVDFAGIA